MLARRGRLARLDVSVAAGISNVAGSAVTVLYAQGREPHG